MWTCILQNTTRVSKVRSLEGHDVNIDEGKFDLTWIYGSGPASPSLGSFKSNTRMLTNSSNPCADRIKRKAFEDHEGFKPAKALRRREGSLENNSNTQLTGMCNGLIKMCLIVIGSCTENRSVRAKIYNRK